MAPPTIDTLRELGNQAETALREVSDAAALEAWRVRYLGRRGQIPQLLRRVKELPENERKEIGRLGNAIRQRLEKLYTEQEALTVSPGDAAGAPRASEPLHRGMGVQQRQDPGPTPMRLGHLHPLTQSLRRAQEIFAALGFQFVEGPDIEKAVYNFDNLNIPPEHPSRADTDTFYLEDFPNLVLRTHVSTLQSRAVLESNLQPPFRIFYYGPTFRCEKEDATHSSVFHQYEFMVVDETVNLSHLKSIVQTFYSLFFGKDVAIRFRPSYFPFVEPGLEVDMRNRVTQKNAWLEMAGAGQVHPAVLKNLGIDPAKYQGIALGGGLDRLAMLLHNIPDIRLLYSGNTRFLTQF